MTLKIHPTAQIETGAEIADGVTVGAYSIIGSDVKIGENCEVGPHVVITGDTTIGTGNRFFQFSSIGEEPQDKKYRQEKTSLVIGNNNTIREGCTLHRGTIQDAGVTSIGSNNWIMAYVHIAHDCVIGDNTILANNATLAGHVHVGDWVVLGGFTTVHQFCHIGKHAMTAFTAAVSQDVPPYVMAAGNRATPAGINSEGLRRRGFTEESIQLIKKAYKILYRSGMSLLEAQQAIEELAKLDACLLDLYDFLLLPNRGIIR